MNCSLIRYLASWTSVCELCWGAPFGNGGCEPWKKQPITVKIKDSCRLRYVFDSNQQQILVGGLERLIFSIIYGNVIIPTDGVIFFRGVGLNHQPDFFDEDSITRTINISDDSSCVSRSIRYSQFSMISGS